MYYMFKFMYLVPLPLLNVLSLLLIPYSSLSALPLSFINYENCTRYAYIIPLSRSLFHHHSTFSSYHLHVIMRPIHFFPSTFACLFIHLCRFDLRKTYIYCIQMQYYTILYSILVFICFRGYLSFCSGGHKELQFVVVEDLQ